MEELEQRQFIAAGREAVSLSYHNPQRRKRAYMVAYRKRRGRSDDYIKQCVSLALDFAERLGATYKESADGTKTYTGPPLRHFLYSDKSSAVVSEIERRKEARSQADSSSEAKEAQLWKDSNRALLEKQGITVSQCAVPEEQRTEYYSLLTPRQ